MSVHLVNPSDNSFGTAVITPRWLFVLAAATPQAAGDPILVDESLEQIVPESIMPGDIVGISAHKGNALRGYEVGRMARGRSAWVIYEGVVFRSSAVFRRYSPLRYSSLRYTGRSATTSPVGFGQPAWCSSGDIARLEVSSSNFPRLDRNRNTGNKIASEVNVISAKQTVGKVGSIPHALSCHHPTR
jgi:hypothetical protein